MVVADRKHYRGGPEHGLRNCGQMICTNSIKPIYQNNRKL
jgi:hypothetical protein